MAAYQTSADLVAEVLANLGVWGIGQTISPEDFSYIHTRLDGIFRKIAALEIVYVADQEQIPGEWFVDLAAIVAGECVSKFGGSPNLVNLGLGGEGNVPLGAGTAAKSLKQMLRGRPTGEPLRVQVF